MKPIPGILAAALAWLLMLAPVCAQSATDGPANGQAEPSADESKEKSPDESKPDKDEPKPGEPSLLDKLSKELFKEIDDGSGKPDAGRQENKLDSAARGMRSAGEKLNDDLTGKETRQIQEQVIRDLDELIKQMQNPPPPQGGSGGGGGSSSNSRSSSGGGSSMRRQAQARQTPQSQGGQGKPQSTQQSDASGGQERKNAEGSQERTDKERKASEEAARKKKLEMDVWGHLPPHLREQLLNTYGERMLPRYEHLVKQFYEALSEQSQGPRQK